MGSQFYDDKEGDQAADTCSAAIELSFQNSGFSEIPLMTIADLLNKQGEFDLSERLVAELDPREAERQNRR